MKKPPTEKQLAVLNRGSFYRDYIMVIGRLRQMAQANCISLDDRENFIWVANYLTIRHDTLRKQLGFKPITSENYLSHYLYRPGTPS